VWILSNDPEYQKSIQFSIKKFGLCGYHLSSEFTNSFQFLRVILSINENSKHLNFVFALEHFGQKISATAINSFK